MSEYTLKGMDVAKEMPGYSGGPAKVLALVLEDDKGQEHSAELFTMASTVLPVIGEKLEGTIESSDYGPKFRRGKGGGQKGGGFKRSPADTKAIQRQHSQEMALRREANLIAAGLGAFGDDQLRDSIDWFESDIKPKAPTKGVVTGPMTSDVPGDKTEPTETESSEELPF